MDRQLNRRGVLRHAALAGAVVGSGCVDRFREPQQRLWFVRIFNGSSRSVDVTLSVRRGGTEVFSETYADIPSFQDVEDEEASYADKPNIQFISSEWAPEPGRYSIRYTYRDQTVDVPVAEIEDVESDDLGVEMTFLGGASGAPRPTFQLVEFSSETEVRDFLDSVDGDAESE